MLFSVFALDNPDATDKRKAVHGAHVAHLKNAKAFGVTITVGGPLVSDDGATSIGSLMVLETSARQRGKVQPCRSIPSERRLGKGRDPAI